MQKMYILPFLVLVLFLAGICSGASWQTVITFTGQESQGTDYFYIPTTEWRIIWNCTIKSWHENYTMFSFLVFPRGGTNIVGAVLCNTREDPTSGVTYVYKGARYFRLSIVAQYVDNYTISIEYNTSPSSTSPSSTPQANGTPYSVYIIIIVVVTAIILLGILALIKKKKMHKHSNTNPPLTSLILFA